jgi:hypothetical protein
MSDKEKHVPSIFPEGPQLDHRPVDDIFPEAHRSIAMATGFCASPPIGCGQKVKGFSDAVSAREYNITSLCQNCQDRIFAEPDEEDEHGPSSGEA